MTIPPYKDIMLPFLRSLSDGKVHSLKELYQVLADQMQLYEEARSQLLPAGSQSIFCNRVGWARTYLKKALLIGAVESGQLRIADRGQALLRQQPACIRHWNRPLCPSGFLTFLQNTIAGPWLNLNYIRQLAQRPCQLRLVS